ncbi:unnamed protein product [Rhizophagus irregularis]|nr:unnamed protein product [Rhizophagus irregularis]
MQASPLNDPDIVAEMVKNLPVEEFGAAEKWEKANDALGRSFEEEGIFRELEWEAYQKACEERKEARKEHIMLSTLFLRCGLQLISYLRIENTSGR